MMKNKLLLIALFTLLSSCVTEKGAMKYYLKHNDQLAELCAAKFPVKERVVQGAPVIVHDTSYTPGPTIPCPQTTNTQTGEKSQASVKCPDTKTVYTNTSVHDTIYREDTARLTALKNKSNSEAADMQANYQISLTSNSELQGNLKSAKADLKKANSGLTWYKWVCGIMAVIIGLMGVVIIKK